MIETIKNTLNSNQNITNEVKESLLELIELFHKNFSDVDLNNLNERLKTLIIKRESMFLVKLPCRYNAHTNEILVNASKIEESDIRHWMMHALLGIITAKENYYGFDNSDNTLLALNEGYTEILTNYLTGDLDDNFFTDEIIITNLIASAIGEDTLFDAYFKTGYESIIKAMTDAEGKEKFNQLMNQMNIDLENKKRKLPIRPIEKQKLVAEIFPDLALKHPIFEVNGEYISDFWYLKKDYFNGHEIDDENIKDLVAFVNQKVAASQNNNIQTKPTVIEPETVEPETVEAEKVAKKTL